MTAPMTGTRPVQRALGSPASLTLIAILLAWGTLAPDYLAFLTSAAFPVAIVGLALLVLQGWTREICLAGAGVFASTMYWFNWLDRPGDGVGLPWGVAAAITLCIPVVFMAGLAAVSMKLPPMYLVILTAGVQMSLENTIFTVSWLSGGVSGGSGGAPLINPRPEPFGIDLRGDSTWYYVSLTVLAVVLVGLIRLRRSPTGLGFLLVGSNRQAAAAVGIPSRRFRIQAYAVAGLLFGVAGILGAMTYVSPPLYLNYRVQNALVLLAIPVVAGVDSMASVIVVSAYLIVTPMTVERWGIDQNFIAAAALGFGALFGVRGIGGIAQDLERRRRFGKRRQRTRRRRMAAMVLREGYGLAAEQNSVLAPHEREECLAVLEQWLPPRPTDGGIAIRVTDISRSFGAIHALEGATLEVPVGRMVGLIGPNGAGKTTLFDVISGFTAADSGRIEVFGEDITHAGPFERSKLGMTRTFQSTRVIPELTGGDNICAGSWKSVNTSAGAFVLGSPRAAARMREAERVGLAAARLLDVDKYWDERVGTLEFSARRRIEIARALVSGPRLLLLDEPAAGLDPASSSAMFSLIRRLHGELGLTVLIVEHYVRAVLDTCDLVHVLAEGAVLASGTPREIAAHPVVRERYLGTRMDYLEGTPMVGAERGS